jgi:hypothetical protein
MQELLRQSGIEHMPDPDTCFLQLLADDRRVRLHISGVDRHPPAGLSQDAPVACSIWFAPIREGEGLVCPVLRLGLRPALNIGWRDRFHQLGSRFANVCSHRLSHNTGITGGMQVGCAASLAPFLCGSAARVYKCRRTCGHCRTRAG